MVKNLTRLWIVSLLVAWLLDYLFWEKQAGISISVFLVILVLGGLLLARLEGARSTWKSLVLLLPIAAFALMIVFRREPMTIFLSVTATLWLLGLLVSSFISGRWWEFTFINHLVEMILVGVSAGTGAIQWGMKKREQPEPGEETEDEETTAQRPVRRWRTALPVARGLLLATPVILILVLLLASADMVFAGYIEDFTDIFRLENLPEYIFRGFYILAFGYVLVGLYGHALIKSHNERLDGEQKSALPSFLGFTESAIVLGSVDLLFAVFVFIQFRYFFGGQANIHLDGYTYAEYARRGFGELVAVAVISIILFLSLSSVAKRDKKQQRSIFSGMGIALVILLGVILVSAFQRLNLYEQAYGFTRMRMYPRVFMIWLGVFLGILVILEVLQRQRRFFLAFLGVCIGFALTLGMVNVDARIVHHNVGRVFQGEELDYTYLLDLSTDAVPALWAEYNNPQLTEEYQTDLGVVLACQAAELEAQMEETHWQSFHFSDWRARQLFDVYADELSRYPVTGGETYAFQVVIGGVARSCNTWYFD